MSIFSSYPGDPPDDSGPCEVCGLDPDKDEEHGGCVCPACFVCGEVGDPLCYEAHSMTRTARQIASLAAAEAAYRFAEPDPDPSNWEY